MSNVINFIKENKWKIFGYTVAAYFILVFFLNLICWFVCDETIEVYYPTLNLFGFNESQYVPLEMVD